MSEDAVNITLIKELLNIWWATNRREYPWRHTTNEYEIVVAELLLQQTTAEAVEKIYPIFVKKFPDWHMLHATEICDIISIIRPLGLSCQKGRRLKNLASEVLENGGKLPQSRNGLEALSGIGSYTANAVSSISRASNAPLLDVNMARVLNRLYGKTPKTDRDYWRRDTWLREKSIEVFPTKNDGWMTIDFAKALCRTNPLCASCPVKNSCRYYTSRRDYSNVGCHQELCSQHQLSERCGHAHR